MGPNLADLGVTINHIIRYGYGGLLLFFAGAIVVPELTWQVVHALGGAGWLSALTAFAIGGAVYVFHRPIVNNLIIDGLHRRIHLRLEPRWGYKTGGEGPTGFNCKLHYLEHRYDISPASSLDAFRSVRDSLFDAERRKRFELNHSENHLLGITFFVLLPFSLVGFSQGKALLGITLLTTSILAIVLGLYSDLFICRRECRHLMTLDGEAVRDILRRSGLTSK